MKSLGFNRTDKQYAYGDLGIYFFFFYKTMFSFPMMQFLVQNKCNTHVQKTVWTQCDLNYVLT